MVNLIVSPDTKRGKRLPPGQKESKKLQVLQFNGIPQIDIGKWRFRMWGRVENEMELTFEELVSLPSVKVYCDVHCVTGWSVLGITWGGVSSKEIVKLCNPDANFVIVHSADGYTTNLSLDDFLQDDVVFAYEMNGERLTLEHGFPLRLVVPRLYFWKSAKWVTGVKFTEIEERGYWESKGYHNRGDPWREERYSR
jgi:DMSO/TMAO reductase YedYZ molybdopterin-dependent catalytic subunit